MARNPDSEYSELRTRLIFSLKAEWLANKERFSKLYLEAQDMTFYYNQSKQMLINWLHTYLKHKIYQYPAPSTEVMLFSKPDRLCGRIDAIYQINGKPVVFDFKTNKDMVIAESLKIQLGIYALLYECKFGQRPSVAVHFLNFKDGLKFFRISDTLMARTKREVKELHDTLSRSTKSTDFPCKCRVKRACENDFYT